MSEDSIKIVEGIVDKKLAEKKFATQDEFKHIEGHMLKLTEAQKPKQDDHKHATHSYDKFCPGCGGKNPDYKKPNVKCKNCGQKLGTVEDLPHIAACPNCGKDEAEEFESDEDDEEE